MRRGAPGVALALTLLAGCGGGAGDLITITTAGGGSPGHRFVVIGNGQGSCDGGAERTLPSDHVLDAREVERELEKPAKARASYTHGPAGARRYTATTKDGVVSWVEGARGAPAVIAKALVLTLELRRDLCPGP
jgi:hypothetical protein